MASSWRKGLYRIVIGNNRKFKSQMAGCVSFENENNGQMHVEREGPARRRRTKEESEAAALAPRGAKA